MPSVTSTSDSSQPPHQPGQQESPQIRVAILPAHSTQTLYANAFQTCLARDEILLTVCLSRQESNPQGPLLTVQPQQTIAMTPESARRLYAALEQTLQQYDTQFGKN